MTDRFMFGNNKKMISSFQKQLLIYQKITEQFYVEIGLKIVRNLLLAQEVNLPMQLIMIKILTGGQASKLKVIIKNKY